MIRHARCVNQLAALGRSRRGRVTRIAAATVASVGFLLPLGLGAAAASADSCPNAQFRTGPSANLPDCRAYEMVSPADTNGAPVNPPAANSDVSAVSGDGQHVFYVSSTAFPGATSAPAFEQYLSTRTATGWTTTDLAPSGVDVSALFSVGVLLDAPADFSRPVFATPYSLDPNDQDGDPNNAFACPFNPVPGYTCQDFYVRNTDGSFTWVSQDGQPKTTVTNMFYAGESADQSHTLFEELPALATPNGQLAGSALYDRTAGHTIAVGVKTDGSLTSACGSVIGATPALGFTLNVIQKVSLQPSNAVSSDGSRVFFESPDPEASGDASCSIQQGGTQPVEVYLRQGNATTTEISLSQKTGSLGTPAPDGATFDAATPDGSKLLFTSPDQLTDDATGTPPYLYEYNVNASGDPLAFLTDNAQPPPAQLRSVVGFSPDLSYIYFSRGSGLALWHNGTVTSLLQLHAELSDVEVTPNGRRLVYANGIVNVNREVYLFDAETGHTSCLSCSPGGAPPAGDSHPADETLADLASREISDDGSRVFFQSPNPLAPQAVAGQQNVYEWQSGTVHLISDATGPYGAEVLGASSSGNDVFFTTADSLVPQDLSNGDTVVYDARVDGGLSGPPATPSVCQGEACQGQPSAPPPFEAPGSASFSGPGNLAPPPLITPPKKATRCAKHKKLRHGKCVKASKSAKRSKSHRGGKSS